MFHSRPQRLVTLLVDPVEETGQQIPRKTKVTKKSVELPGVVIRIWEFLFNDARALGAREPNGQGYEDRVRCDEQSREQLDLRK